MVVAEDVMPLISRHTVLSETRLDAKRMTSKYVSIPCCNRSWEMVTTTASDRCPSCGYKSKTITVTIEVTEPIKRKPKPIKKKVLPIVVIGKSFKPKQPQGFAAKFFKEGRV